LGTTYTVIHMLAANQGDKEGPLHHDVPHPAHYSPS